MAFVTTPAGKLCSYYTDEADPVNLEEYAIAKHIPVYRPKKIKTATFYDQMVKYNPDYFLIANYQKILDAKLINLPNQKALNFHPSPLPRYAGLAPFFWMAKCNEKDSGVSCISISPEIDGGDIVLQLPINLTGNETALEIRNKLFSRSLDLLNEVLELITNHALKTKKQSNKERNYFSNPTLEDMSIDNNSTVKQAITTLKSCSPKPAYLCVSNKRIPVNFIGYTKIPNSIYVNLKDGNLYFLPEALENE